MAKYKHNNRNQIEMRMIDFTEQLVEGTLEHTIDYLLEKRIDLGDFDEMFHNNTNGAPAYNPKILLKVILYAYANGILGSRKIEKACEQNIIFMTLSGGHVPHFTSIADFIHRFDVPIKKVFKEVLLICCELDLIGGEFLAVDGCKFASNSAKEWSGTFSDLEKKETKIRKTVEFLLEKHKGSDRLGIDCVARRQTIEKLESKADRIRNFLENNEPRLGPRGREIQSNVTDNQSARLKSAHGWVQGYNGVAMVDSKSQVILGAEVFGGNNEGMYLREFLQETRISVLDDPKNDFLASATLLADTGFFSEDNLKYLSDEKIKCLIPDQYYRKRDPRFATKSRHNTGRRKGYLDPSQFIYDAENHQYICPNNCQLTYKGIRKLGKSSGKRYESNPQDCKICSLKAQCHKDTNCKIRTIYNALGRYEIDYVKEMMSNIDSVHGRETYSKRMGIVEPVFANIRHAKRMDRFNYRTKRKVNSQWVLYCMVHNIGKITLAMRN